MEYKTVPIAGVTKDASEGNGIVTAIVSVTGVKDNVNDVIQPGAYTATLEKRLPKGVWQHDWNQPVSKTLDIKELMPGDKSLPPTLPDGSPWPKEAGALQVKMQFNMKTDRGRDAYQDVLFFGPDQEWSIGYQVPDGAAQYDTKSGVRNISTLDLFEFSPVLFGAMPSARTKSVKEAQLAFKSLNSMDEDGRIDKPGRYESEDDEEFDEDNFTEDELEGVDRYAEKALRNMETKRAKIVPSTQGSYYQDDDPDGDGDNDLGGLDDYDDDGNYVGKGQDPLDANKMRDIVGLMEEELKKSSPNDNTKGMETYIETKAANYATLQDAIRDVIDEPSPKLVRFAGNFDNSVEEKDLGCANELEEDICEMLTKSIDDAMDNADLEAETAHRVVARVIADQLDSLAELDGEPEWKSGVYHVETKAYIDLLDNGAWTRNLGVLFKGDTRLYDSTLFARSLSDMQLKELAAFSTRVSDFVMNDVAVKELRERQEVKRKFSQAQRDKAAAEDHAMPDGSYPMENRKDVDNAIRSLGRTPRNKRAAVMALIKKRAKALGCEDLLPESWESGKDDDMDADDTKSANTTVEVKSNSISDEELKMLRDFAGVSDD